MHWRERLDKKTLTVCFAFLTIFLVLSTACVGTVVGVNKAEMTRYSVNDKWKFSVDYKGEFGMLGTLTSEITGDSVEITEFGKHYVCYEVSITAGGTVYGELYGEGITGTWTMNGKMYAQKSDLSDVKSTITTDVTVTYAGESMTMEQVIETTYNPPLESSGPLTVGESWSAATTETTTMQTTIDGDVDQETDTTSGTWNYFVLRTEPITVSAGEFDTFVIRATDPDGSYSESYYSQEVGESVKVKEYDETGKLVGTVELLEYSYAAAEEEFPWLWVIIGIVIAAAVITSGVGYVLYKRRKPTAPVAPPTPPTPPTEQPPKPTTSQY